MADRLSAILSLDRVTRERAMVEGRQREESAQTQ